MNILTILGGPRKKGSTARMLSVLEDHLKSLNHSVDRINVTDYDINGCISCYKCLKEINAPGCSQKDDAMKIFDRMINSDVIIYSTPLYCWSWAAQIKPLVDRHYCLVKNYGSKQHKSFLETKKSALVVTCGGPLENNADILVTAYNHLMHYCKVKEFHNLVIPFCASPNSINASHEDQARRLAETLVV